MRSRLLAGVLLFGLLGSTPFRADDPKPAKLAPAPAAKTADKGKRPDLDRRVPESVDDLRALEKQVQAIVAKVQPAVVGVLVGPGQGSGVIVKDGYVLTAGHVSGKPGRKATIVLADGTKLNGKT